MCSAVVASGRPQCSCQSHGLTARHRGSDPGLEPVMLPRCSALGEGCSCSSGGCWAPWTCPPWTRCSVLTLAGSVQLVLRHGSGLVHLVLRYGTARGHLVLRYGTGPGHLVIGTGSGNLVLSNPTGSLNFVLNNRTGSLNFHLNNCTGSLHSVHGNCTWGFKRPVSSESSLCKHRCLCDFNRCLYHNEHILNETETLTQSFITFF